ncbi:MAG: glycosyltransferase family 39 protein [Cyanobacteria bacterium SZAS TMP-1]|nr:glycosyltransferase family 39 protein [Cyanobacteria bacterium SZAS TMP-1]
MALACGGLYFNCLGSWAFTDPGESYYTEAAREMLECGDWIVPHLNYQIYFSKPILTFWLIAASYKLFGISELAARLPFAIVATATIFATYAGAKKLFGAKPALLGALIAAGSPLAVVFSKTSPIDLLFCAALNLAVVAFAMSVFAGSLPWACALWAALGIAVLTKGPAGLVLFGLGTALFLLLEKPTLKTLGNWFMATRPALGALIFAAVTVPWYYGVWKATKGLFLEVFFIYENLARLQGKTNLLKSSWFFFIPVLAYGLAPWSLILAQVVKVTFGDVIAERWFGGGRLTFRSTYRPHMRAAATAVEGAKKASPVLPQDEIERLSVYYLSSWCLAVFLFFSISKTQLPTYIQPIITPLALLTAVTITKLFDSQSGDDAKLADKLKYDAKWVNIFTKICAGLSCAAAAACLVASVMPFMPFYLPQRILFAVAGILTAIGAVVQIKRIKAGEMVDALIAHACTIAALTSFLTPAIFQIEAHFRQDNMVSLARQLKDSKEEVALFGTYMPSAMYYMQRPVDYMSEVAQFTAVKEPILIDDFTYGPTRSGRRQLILGDDKHMAQFKQRPELRLKEIARKGDWAIYDLANGFAERPRKLEETFKFLKFSKHSFTDTAAFGPLTVPLGGGDAEWFKYRGKH